MSKLKYKRYKPAKTLDKQVEHLKENKKVLFNILNEEQSKEVLLRYNYINVISPYKHKFALLDEKQQVVKIEGKHIYEREVEFSEYYEMFKAERETYPAIVNNILDFEIHFKSIVAYHIFNNCKFNDSTDVLLFFDKLIVKLALLSNYSKSRILHMQKHLEEMKIELFKYPDVYCFFDRMSLGNTLTVFACLDIPIQLKIFNDIKKYNWNFNVDNINHFIAKVFCLVSIRNCVMHSNSLEILVRFYSVKEHILRKSTDKKRFTEMIKYLKNRKSSQ